MLTLFFEVLPNEGHEGHYFERAAALKPELEKNPGLLFLDRYKSLTRPDWILSYQHWRDEASLVHWRSDAHHHRAQSAGRGKHFADYRLRIAQVVLDAVAGQPPVTSTLQNAYNDPELTAERYVLVIESQGTAFGNKGEGFASINRDAHHASVLTPTSLAEGKALAEEAVAHENVTRALLSLVSRDYGKFDRTEAPQYYPEIKRK